MTIRVQRANLEDAAVISMLNVDVQQIHADAHPSRFKQPSPNTFQPQDAQAQLSKPDHYGWIAFIDDEAVGYLLARIICSEETHHVYADRVLHLRQMSIRAHARRKGVGRALMLAAEDAARESGISTLTLDTWAFNERATSFVEANGFAPCYTRFWKHIDLNM